MDLWALQTSCPNPNPCPLPWVSDYKVIPPSLSCSNWISLRDLWKLTSANAALLFQKLLIDFSKYKLQHDKAECEKSAAHNANINTAGDTGWARDSDYPQVRPACWASLGARWPHCQQAGPGLIKDVKSNWSYQHLLSLHLGGWRQSFAQYAHTGSDLEESHIFRDQTPHKKNVNGMKGHQRNPGVLKHILTIASVPQMDRTISEYKYCCCTTVNPSSLLPFVLILCLRQGLNHSIVQPSLQRGSLLSSNQECWRCVSEKWLTVCLGAPIYFFSGAVFCQNGYWFFHKIRKQVPFRG